MTFSGSVWLQLNNLSLIRKICCNISQYSFVISVFVSLMQDGEGVDVGSISDDSITLVKRCPFHLQGCPWVGEVRHHQVRVLTYLF